MLRRRKRRKIFKEGKYFFAEEKKNREGKGGKYLGEENIFFEDEHHIWGWDDEERLPR